jgi:hypothetical protein
MLTVSPTLRKESEWQRMFFFIDTILPGVDMKTEVVKQTLTVLVSNTLTTFAGKHFFVFLFSILIIIHKFIYQVQKLNFLIWTYLFWKKNRNTPFLMIASNNNQVFFLKVRGYLDFDFFL